MERHCPRLPALLHLSRHPTHTRARTDRASHPAGGRPDPTPTCAPQQLEVGGIDVSGLSPVTCGKECAPPARSHIHTGPCGGLMRKGKSSVILGRLPGRGGSVWRGGHGAACGSPGALGQSLWRETAPHPEGETSWPHLWRPAPGRSLTLGSWSWREGAGKEGQKGALRTVQPSAPPGTSSRVHPHPAAPAQTCAPGVGLRGQVCSHPSTLPAEFGELSSAEFRNPGVWTGRLSHIKIMIRESTTFSPGPQFMPRGLPTAAEGQQLEPRVRTGRLG